MRRLFLLVLLALALPMAAFASNTVDFSNTGGKLTGTNGGLSLSGSSILTVVDGFDGLGLITGNNLGTVTFSTGALTSGSLQMGGTFGAGGSFLITSNGSNGLPMGTLFSGSFSGNVLWTLTTLSNGTHQYTLGPAPVTGTINGVTVQGITSQITINTGKHFFTGSVKIGSGDTNVSSVPEPGSLTLLGTGLLGIASVLHRKLRA